MIFNPFIIYLISSFFSDSKKRTLSVRDVFFIEVKKMKVISIVNELYCYIKQFVFFCFKVYMFS